MGKGLIKDPLSFSMDLDLPQIRRPRLQTSRTPKLGAQCRLSTRVFCNLCLCSPPSAPRQLWKLELSLLQAGCLCQGFVSPLGDSRVCFLPTRPLHKARVTALSRGQSRLSHVCLKAGGLYGKRRVSLSSSAPARLLALSCPRGDGPRPYSVLSCDQGIVLLLRQSFSL